MATRTQISKAGRPPGSRQYKQIVKMPAPPLDECIIKILRSYASGRAPVTTTTISVQLMLRFGIIRSQSSVSNDLRHLATEGIVYKDGYRKPYRLSPQMTDLNA